MNDMGHLLLRSKEGSMAASIFVLVNFFILTSLVVTQDAPARNIEVELNTNDTKGNINYTSHFISTNSVHHATKFQITTEIPSDNATKHVSFYECPQWSLEPGEFIIVNGTAIVEAYNISYNSSFYELKGKNLKICMPQWNTNEIGKQDSVEKYPLSFTYITAVGLGISIFCLLLHLLTFVSVEVLRNLPGYNLAALCLSLLLGYIFFLSGHTSVIQSSYVLCVIAAASSHFFLLGSFLWTNTMAYDVLRVILKATGKLRLSSTRFSIRKFSLNCLYSWGISLSFVIAALMFDNVNGIPPEYRPLFGQEICWFNQRKSLLVFFAAPVFILIIMNAIIFGISSYTIFINRMVTEDAQRKIIRRNFVMYSRLAVIMGLTWIVGVVAGIVDHIILWYIFVILNTLQGLFIFLAFTCTRKVQKAVWERFKLSPRNFASQMTFQTYCNIGASFDTELKAPVPSRNNLQRQMNV